MSKKKITLSIIISLIVLVFGIVVLWYCTETTTNYTPMNTKSIELQDQSSGKSVTITDQGAINRLLDDFNTVTLKKDGFAINRDGYNIKVIIHELSADKIFFIDSATKAKRNGVYYKIENENFDIDYIESLINSNGLLEENNN